MDKWQGWNWRLWRDLHLLSEGAQVDVFSEQQGKPVHTNRTLMPTKTLPCTAPYPRAAIVQLFTVLASLRLDSAPKQSFSIFLRTTFSHASAACLLRDETVFVRLTCKAGSAATGDGPKGCGTAGMTASIKYRSVPHVCRDVQRYPHWKGIHLLVGTSFCFCLIAAHVKLH